MLRKLYVVLLVATVLAAPATVFAEGSDRAAVDRQPSLVERVWDGLVWLLDLDGDRGEERSPRQEGPRNVSANDDGGGTLDPDG